jgi:hypothetical protein
MDPGGSNDEGRNPNVEKDSNFEIGEAPGLYRANAFAGYRNSCLEPERGNDKFARLLQHGLCWLGRLRAGRSLAPQAVRKGSQEVAAAYGMTFGALPGRAQRSEHS